MRAKVSKKSVNYRKATGKHNCGNCAMRDGQTCDLVKGIILITDTCDKWVKKNG